MQKQASQTFQRIRKLSDSIIHAVVPNQPKADESFFEYGKKGWHAPTRPPDSYLHRRPSRRKVSKEDIRYPLLHPTDTHDLWVESATMSAERASAERARPPRPSLDERPLVVRDPELRKEEQRVFKSVNTAKRPERPREEDLPYGSKGSYPKALVKEERPPPPLAAVRGRGEWEYAVPFPTTATREKERGSSSSKKVEAPPPAKYFSPFAPMKTQAQAQGEKKSTHGVPVTNFDAPLTSLSLGPSSAPPYVAAHRATDLRRRGTVPDPERRPRLPPKDAKWADPTSHTYFSTGPAQVRRTGAIRRTSSSGDLHLPPMHARWQPPHRVERERERNENEARRARERPPELRTVKSTPLQPSKRNPGLQAPMPKRANPNPNAKHDRDQSKPSLDRLLCKPEPRDLDVPQDISPLVENPQRLPTPRRSEEDAYPALFRDRSRERESGRKREEKEKEKPMLIPQAPVATATMVAKAQASMRVKESVGPRAVRVAGTEVRERPVSLAAQVQVVGPEREPIKTKTLAEARRGRERAREGKERFYGKADAFAREIGLALAEPESAMSVKWENVVVGQYHGNGTTRPLVIKKQRG